MDSQREVAAQREVGAAFRRARIRSGLTQEEVATLMGVTQPWVSKIEQSARRLAVTEAWQLAEILDVDLEEIKDAYLRKMESNEG